MGDNYFTALNSAVFSDGSFVYVPKGVTSPMELSTYFRINASNTGQFERTLIIAEEDSYVSYLEGCTAPAYDENQLHAAVVELSAARGAEIKYSTVQNWYAGNEEGKGGIYNFVTKRGLCHGDRSKISWTQARPPFLLCTSADRWLLAFAVCGARQRFVARRTMRLSFSPRHARVQVETGSAITWKYPSVVLKGDDSVGEFYSVALTNNAQQADTGTKMVHVGKRTRSKIVSKGISAGRSRNAYRGLVQVQPAAEGARNFSQCDSMLIGDGAAANTYPYIQVRPRAAARRSVCPRRFTFCDARRMPGARRAGAAAERERGARGDDEQDRRRSALLLSAARHRSRGRSGRHHLGLLPHRLQRAAPRVCGRGERAHVPQARGLRGLSAVCGR